jgi:succinate dehydrogenase / fumarate reductase flavoprotein subunit/fumarate reductase (CoM/CoB) subunit A
MPDADAPQTEVLVVRRSAAGIFAPLHAARFRTGETIADKKVVSRGCATNLAQMTCASELREIEPDDAELTSTIRWKPDSKTGRWRDV